MLIIETTKVVLPRFKKFTSESMKGGVNNYLCFAMFGLQVTVVRDALEFRNAVRRYAKDDWSEHKQVRLSKKKERSKVRAQERRWVTEDLDRWEKLFNDEREARMKADDRANERYKTIEAMKITFEELQK